jgi:hypothetical protein
MDKEKKYPYFLNIENVVLNLPLNLSFDECFKISNFLNNYKGILKIEYFDLLKIINSVNNDTFPQPKQLLRTSRYYPYYTILKSISDLPNSLSLIELENMALYLDSNKDIINSHITYKTLLNIINKKDFDEQKNNEELIQEINDFSSLSKIDNLPNDLTDEQYQRLSNYIITHPEIIKISYTELLNRAEPRSPKKRKLL